MCVLRPCDGVELAWWKNSGSVKNDAVDDAPVHFHAHPSAMSNLRNLLKTRTYRERSQPASRQHLGLLEKKKDYVLRARDFHRKEDAIKKLKEKAAFRNPDEYYFKMAHTKVEGGVHRKEREEQPIHDELRKFKREDAGYLMVKQTAEAKKIEKLRASLHMLDAPLQNKHTFFVEPEAVASSSGGHSGDSGGANHPDLSGRGGTPAELAAAGRRKEQRKRAREEEAQASAAADEDEEAEDAQDDARVERPAVSKKARLKLERARAAKYDELQQRQERHSKMGRALERIGLEKALMGKGARRKLKPKKQLGVADADGAGGGGGGGAPRQFKFKQRRKK